MSLVENTAAVNAWWTEKNSERDEILATNGVTAVNWQYSLADGASVVQNEAELDQAIKIILSTNYGQDAHRPTFASNIQPFVDWPIPRATPNIVREIVLSVATWEPRVKLLNVDVQQYQGGIERIQVIAEWQIGSLVSSTTVNLNNG